MMVQRFLLVSALAGFSAYGQQWGDYQTMRAEIRGGGGDGKCTVEVEVDGTAEVEINQGVGRLRTFSGRPARWRRFVCNQVLPPNPVDFRFRGIDGRGRVGLVRDPRNGGVAVVRIDDSRGGAEGYTFDIEWRGVGGGYDRGPGGYDRGPGGYDRGPGGYDRGPGPGAPGPYVGERDRGPGRGPGWGGGWTGRRGGTLHFRGDGRGFFNRQNGRDMPVRDVLVSVNRDGLVTLEFEAQGFQRLAFSGQAREISRTMVTAELLSDAYGRNTRGNATIYIDPRGEVERIEMRGRLRGDPFRLNWSEH